MTTFQQTALLLTVIWLVVVLVRFRRSTVVLVSGLFAIGAYTLAGLALGKVSAAELGLGWSGSWLPTIAYALAGLVVMLVYSPLADWLASRWFAKPPSLEAFGALQQSWVKLLAGILAAWLLGGLLEELIARGIVLQSLQALLSSVWIRPAATGIAVCLAGLGAGGMHAYQGPRAMAIITQLSILFGILFVVSGYNLWAVMLCHGLYDTMAFVRFATRKSKYSQAGQDQGLAPGTKP